MSVLYFHYRESERHLGFVSEGARHLRGGLEMGENVK